MKLKDAHELTGLSERTLKSYIKQGKLDAVLVGSGQHRHWEINPESLETIEKKPPKDESSDDSQQNDLQFLVNAQQHQLQVLEKELEVKNKQIEQLHILLQQAQAALPSPNHSRAWWRFWQRG
jgi:predicted site-specific integrase-resolvase